MEIGTSTTDTAICSAIFGREAKATPVTSFWQTCKSALRRLWIPRRRQGFEFCDQAWLNGVWREAYLDGLRFLFMLGGTYRQMCHPYSQWAKAAGQDRVLDLASGNGGPMETLQACAQQEGLPMPHVTLSDLQPDVASFERLARRFEDKVSFIPTPFDAMSSAKGADQPRLLSICTAFHHFPPEQAQRLLTHATEHADGIFIMEVFSRNLFSLVLSLVNLLPLMLAPFFAQRFSLGKMLISTVLPVVPLMIMFDGVVSAWRTYRPEEILAMVPSEKRAAWKWQVGAQYYLGFIAAPYIYGYRPH